MRALTSISVLLLIACSALAQMGGNGLSKMPTLASPEANREMALVRGLLVKPNSVTITNFDKQICRSLHLRHGKPMVVSMCLITFTFYHPRTNADIPSCYGANTEPGDPDELVCNHGTICRTNLISNEVPVNYVQLVDTSKRQDEADVDLLLGVAPLQDLQDMRYFKRSFRFVWNGDWKEK